MVPVMENSIKVGSVVYHRNPQSNLFKGPGTVIKIEHEPLFDVDAYTVLWQSAGDEWVHYRSSLMTLAERESK